MLLAIDTEASLTAFREKHARLFEQTRPGVITEDISPRIKRSHSLRVMRLAAVIFALMFGCMITAQALGLYVFGAIVR